MSPRPLQLRKRAVRLAACLLFFVLSACSGPQSTLDPAGHDAEKLAGLFWVMTIGSLVIWAVVIAVAFLAARERETPPREETANLLILGGGLVFPIVVLTALLIYGLALMAALRAVGGAG